MNGNGWKSWALGALGALIFVVTTWAVGAVQRHDVDIAVLKETLNRLERKLDEALARK